MITVPYLQKINVFLEKCAACGPSASSPRHVLKWVTPDYDSNVLRDTAFMTKYWFLRLSWDRLILLLWLQAFHNIKETLSSLGDVWLFNTPVWYHWTGCMIYYTKYKCQDKNWKTDTWIIIIVKVEEVLYNWFSESTVSQRIALIVTLLLLLNSHSHTLSYISSSPNNHY